VDSDNELSVTDDAFARFAFHRLYTSCDIDATIDELLAFIGARFNVSRVYIFEDSPDGSACSNTFEWCNAGISPEKDGLQNLSYTTDLPGWKELYDERGVFYCPDVSVLSAPLRAVLEPQEIKSMLQCAIMDGDTFRGFVGFDECSANRLWTQGQIDLLDFLAEVLAVFLLKQRSRQRPPDLAQPPPWEAQ
jgi:GAF domain-containing protein